MECFSSYIHTVLFNIIFKNHDNYARNAGKSLPLTSNRWKTLQIYGINTDYNGNDPFDKYIFCRIHYNGQTIRVSISPISMLGNSNQMFSLANHSHFRHIHPHSQCGKVLSVFSPFLLCLPHTHIMYPARMQPICSAHHEWPAHIIMSSTIHPPHTGTLGHQSPYISTSFTSIKPMFPITCHGLARREAYIIMPQHIYSYYTYYIDKYPITECS